jgi:hypothetical protein
LCIDCFTTVHDGKTIKKREFPRPLLHGKIVLTTTDGNQANSSTILNVFINRSRALMKTLQDFIKETLEGMTYQQLNRETQCYSSGPKATQTPLPMLRYHVAKDVVDTGF